MAAVLTGLAASAAADTSTFRPVLDNTIFSPSCTVASPSGCKSNGAGSHLYMQAGVSSALLEFNVGGTPNTGSTIPPGSTINSVTLTMHSSLLSGVPTVSLKRVNQSWGQAGSVAGIEDSLVSPSAGGAGAPAQTNDSTWAHRFFSATAWSHLGGTCFPGSVACQSAGSVRGTRVVNSFPGSFTFNSTASMIQDVGDWLANSSNNHGWMMLASTGGVRFDSREHSVASRRPLLTVNFTPPDIVTIDSGPAAAPNSVSSTGISNLSVSASDTLGHTVSYAWSASCPGIGLPGAFSNANAQNPSWTAPVNTTGGSEVCTLSVVASDSFGNSDSDDVAVTVGSVVLGSGETVAVFDDPTYVDDADPGGEATNLKATLVALGHSVLPFSGISALSFSGALAGADALAIPELERADLAQSLDAATLDVIRDFVARGGRLLTFGSPTRAASLMNALFGSSIAPGVTGNGTLTTRASATSFAGGAVALPANNGSSTITSLPVGSTVVYATAGGAALVASIDHGFGEVFFLGWDWFNAAPVGAQDNGWLAVLDSALRSRRGVGVAVFDDPTIVDSSDTGSAESDTLQASLASLGHRVSTFVEFSVDALRNADPGVETILIPEQELGTLTSVLDDTEMAYLASFVRQGGRLVVHGSSGGRVDSLLGSVFGITIGDFGNTGDPQLADAGLASSEFSGGAPTLPANSATFLLNDLPPSSLSVYASADGSSVVLFPFGDGSIVFLGWDWFNAAPLGPVADDWLDVLDRAVRKPRPGTAVAVYNDPALVDVNDPVQGNGGESVHVRASLHALGHTTKGFTGVTGSAWAAGLDGAEALLFPEPEGGEPATVLDPDALDAAREFVRGGGRMIVHGTNFGPRVPDYLNALFGYSTAEQDPPGNSTITAAAMGTEFDGGPAGLPEQSATRDLLGLPARSSSIYDSGTGASVALIAEGEGSIVYLGWDWFSAAPRGAADGGWLEVLDRSVALPGGAPSDAVVITSAPTTSANPLPAGGIAALDVRARDSRGHPIGFSWTASCPGLGSNGGFDDPTAQTPQWTPPQNLTGFDSDCTLTVDIFDGFGGGDQASLVQTLSPVPNDVSIASGPTASPDPVASRGTTTLSAMVSDDLGRTLTHVWQAICPGLPDDGSFDDDTLSSPNFTAPLNTTGLTQVCTVQLDVDDGVGNSDTAQLALSVAPAIDQVVILAGPSSTTNPVDSQGVTSVSVTADDDFAHPLGYVWTSSCPGLGDGTFSDAGVATPTWTAPSNTTGSTVMCTLAVTASDAFGNDASGMFVQSVLTLPDEIFIFSGPTGSPNPVASSGTATMSILGFDSIGHPLTYGWSANCPALGGDGSFSDSTASAVWTAPANPTGSTQSCTVSVVVSDGFGTTAMADYSHDVLSAPDAVTISSGPTATPNPVASLGTASLSVTAADSLGHPLNYAWSALCSGIGSNGSFDDAALASPVWTAPLNQTMGARVCDLSVEVSDDFGQLDSSSTPQLVRIAQDRCDLAFPVASLPFNVVRDTSDATGDGSDPTVSCSAGVGGASVWYRYTPSETGDVSVSTLGSSYDTVISVWLAAEACGALSTEQACNDDASGGLQSALDFTAQAGTAYLVQVAARAAGPGGTLQLQIPEPARVLLALTALATLQALRRRRRAAESRPRQR